MTTSASMVEQVSAQPEFGPQMPLSEKLLAIAIRAQNFTGASGVAVAIKEGQEVVCRASWGTSAPDVGVRLQDQNSFTYQCLRAGKAMRCDDAYSDPRVDNAACKALDIRSIAAAPVACAGDVLGVLAAFSEDANAFSETHLVVLTTLGEVVGKFLKDAEALGDRSTDDLLAIEDLPEITAQRGPETPKSAEPPKSEAVGSPKVSVEPPKAAPVGDDAPKATAQAPKDVPEKPATVLSWRVENARSTSAAAGKSKRGMEVEREPEIRPDSMVSGSEVPRDPSLVNSDAPTPPATVSAKAKSKLSSLGEKRPAWLGMIDHASKTEQPETVEPLAAEPTTAGSPESKAPTTPVSKVAPVGTPASSEPISLTFTEPAEPVTLDKRKYMMLGGAAAVLILVLGLWTWHSHRASEALPQVPPAPQQQQVAENDPSFQPPPVEQTEAPAPVRTVDKGTNQKPNAKKDESAEATVEDTVKIVKAPIRKPAAAAQPLPEPEAPPSVNITSASLPSDLLAVKTALPNGPAPPTSHFVPSEVTKKVTPVFPEVAKRSHMQGKVVLTAKVDSSGNVQDVKVISGPAAFRQSAMEAVRRWKYKPAVLNGQPVDSSAEITLNFAAR